MLRAVVNVLAALALAVAVIATIAKPAAWPVLVPAGVLALGVLAERRLRRAAPAGPGWRRTEERFLDPETGRATVVWFDPVTGERRYVVDATANEMQ